MQAIRVMLLAVMLLTAYNANSAIYSYITRSEGTPENAKYWWTIEYWDTVDATPNPCYGWGNVRYLLATGTVMLERLALLFLMVWNILMASRLCGR